MRKLVKFSIVMFGLLILAYAGISFADGATAVNGVATQDVGKGVGFLQKAIQTLYLILWPFIFLAGKFLSNDFVYGSAFGIDNVLWKLWQVTRVFANYMIGIVFIGSLFIYFFKENSNLSWKKNLPRVLISAIVINMSWFLLAVLIDLSTILTVAFGSIGSHFNPGYEKNPDGNTIVPIVIDIDGKGEFVKVAKKGGGSYDVCILDKENEILNKPCINFLDGSYKIESEGGTQSMEGIKTDNIQYSAAGMLISLFRYMNGAFLHDNTSTDGSTFFMFMVKLILLALLMIPFLVLCIILVVRVLVLWVVIPLSPFILGSYILGIFDTQIQKNFKNIIALILQPAYVVLALSIGFVFVQSVYNMIPTSKEGSEERSKNILKEVGINPGAVSDGKQEIHIGSANRSLMTIETNYEPGQGSNTNPSDMKNILAYFSWLIANVFAIMVLRTLVFAALKSNSFTEKIASSVEGVSKEIGKSAQILPYGHSITSVQKIGQQIQSIPSMQTMEQTSKLSSLFKGKKNGNNNNNSGNSGT